MQLRIKGPDQTQGSGREVLVVFLLLEKKSGNRVGQVSFASSVSDSVISAALCNHLK